MLPSERYRSRLSVGRSREAMTCASTRIKPPENFTGSSTVSSSSNGTVLPPSFHPLNSRTPRERTTLTRSALSQGVPHGSSPDQRQFVPALGNAGEASQMSIGSHVRPDLPSVPISMINRGLNVNCGSNSLHPVSGAMLQQSLGFPSWNALGLFPMMPMEPLAPSQLPVAGFQHWTAKQPVINRDYLELAMLVCNTFRGKLFPCPHCRYVTDRRNNLKRHIATMHEQCEKTLECCGVAFQTKASLREHIMIFHHNGYSCAYCGRRFCRKALLKRHLSVHSGRKDYSCPHCDYATSHKSNLERHKKIHDRSCKSPHLDDTSSQTSMYFADEPCPVTSQSRTTTTSGPTVPREASPAPPDSTVTCSALDLSSSVDHMKVEHDVMNFSDSSLSDDDDDDDIDVECG